MTHVGEKLTLRVICGFSNFFGGFELLLCSPPLHVFGFQLENAQFELVTRMSQNFLSFFPFGYILYDSDDPIKLPSAIANGERSIPYPTGGIIRTHDSVFALGALPIVL